MSGNKKTIVHVIDRLHAGGAERVLTMQANLFYENGHHVKVITTVSSGPLRELLNKDILFECLNRKWKWSPATMYRLVKAIKNFDVVHVHSSHNLRYVFLAMKLFFLKKKIFFQEHSGKIHVNKYVSPDRKYIYPKVFVICVSDEIAKWAKEDVGVPASQVFVLPNIIVKEDVPQKEKEITDKIKLVLVSNFVPSKNIEFAVMLLHKLIDDGGKYSLTITGLIADKEYYQKIMQLIKENNLEEDVKIISDCLHVQAILHQYDLAIHTTSYESGPLVLIEYMAQGLLFLTYNTGQVVEIIKPAMPGCIVSSFDMEEWKIKIESITNSDKMQVQKKMQEIFESFFSAEKYYETCNQIYDSCV